MKTIYRNPEVLPTELLIEEDTHLVFFFSGARAALPAKCCLTVSPQVSLKVTYIDFAKSDADLDFDVVLKDDARAELSLASLNEEHKKVYRFNVRHEGVRSYSRTKMGGINDGKGVLRFLGSSYIRNGAHKCDTRQEGKITNLSADCKSEVSPSLLIKENDVRASHGAALGAYNPDHLFYLMSRGLTMEESKRLITYGSLLPMIESAEDDSLIEEAKNSLGAITL